MSDFKQSDFTLRLGNRDKTTRIERLRRTPSLTLPPEGRGNRLRKGGGRRAVAGKGDHIAVGVPSPLWGEG